MQTTTIFKVIAKKQEQYYKTLPNEIRQLINQAVGSEFVYKGQKAMITCIYTDSTADIVVMDGKTGEETELNVSLEEL